MRLAGDTLLQAVPDEFGAAGRTKGPGLKLVDVVGILPWAEDGAEKSLQC
jgi:hypothetical protein